MEESERKKVNELPIDFECWNKHSMLQEFCTPIANKFWNKVFLQWRNDNRDPKLIRDFLDEGSHHK